MRILIADDEKMICELLTEALQPLGHEVFSASNGLEALRMFEQISPGIVILDITMPGLDGYGVLSQIRRIGAAPRVFVLMLTGRSQLEELERSLQSGADDYLPKPFTCGNWWQEFKPRSACARSRRNSSFGTSNWQRPTKPWQSPWQRRSG